MIVDSHIYCFEAVDRPAGHSSGAEHLKWVQAAQASHHQPAWRVRDRSAASSESLNPENTYDFSRLPDAKFRADHERGRIIWTVGGEDYTKQMFPANLRNVEFTPHSAIAEMDYAGVDVALIHTDPMLGRDSEFLSKCVQAYPDRLGSMAPVDEWRIIKETDAVIDELNTAVTKHGLHAIKFNTPMAYIDNVEPWDDGPFRPFWQAATALKVPIFFTIGTGPAQMSKKVSVDEARNGYLQEQRVLMRWMERYPNNICSLTHGLPWRLYLNGEQINLPDDIWAPFENPNCHLEVCFPVRLGDLFDFPYREVWSTLEQMVEHIGADHLLWGTDMPFQNRFCTYRQSRQWIEKYCSFLSRDDLAKMMGGTTARILGL
jgi:predicted TIM-barrel fold metal-dependent hydrolase